jgi:hypothetical protein
MKKKVSILSAFGFAKRNLKSSRLADKLRSSGYDVSDDDYPVIRNRWRYYTAEFKTQLTRQLYHRWGEIQQFRKHMARKAHRNDPEVARWDRYDSWNGFPFVNSQTTFEILDWIYRHLPSNIDPRYQPDLVLLTDMQDVLAQNTIRHCDRHGIPLICINSSWDHLTHRGRVIDSPKVQQYLVWNEIQQNELQRIHGISADRTEIVGSLQFDALHRISSDDSRRTRERLGIGPDELVLFLPAYNSRLGPHEADNIEWIIQQKLDVPNGFRVVVRPYPGDQDFNERFARVLQSDRVILSSLLENESDDYNSMSQLLVASDIVLTTMSTAAIEAMYYDIPVIHLGIDATESRNDSELFKKYFFSDHYQHVMKHNASHYVQTYQELSSAIEDCISRPSQKRAARARVVHEQVQFLDGHAADRIVSAVTRFFDSASSSGQETHQAAA